MDKIGISLCMICNNEESIIDKALDSAIDIVDEIIIIDIGSKSKAIDIDKKYGARIYKENFQYDFSKIRNICLERATKKWIFILNCNEIIPEEYKDDILNCLNESEDLKGICVRTISYLDGVRRNAENSLRIFKNDRNIRFEGRANETAMPSILRRYGNDSIILSDIEIWSHKNLIDCKEKSKLNLKILNSYKNKERDSYFYFNLGNEYGKLLQFDVALEKYNLAFKNLKRSNLDYSKKLILNKSKALYQMKEYDELENFLDKYIKEYPQFKDLYFIRCLMKIEKFEFSEALDSLLNYMYMKEDIKYPSSEFEQTIDIEELKKKLMRIDSIIV